MSQGWNPFDNGDMINTTQCIGWYQDVSTSRRSFVILLHPTYYGKHVNETPWSAYSRSDRQGFKLYQLFAMLATHGTLGSCTCDTVPSMAQKNRIQSDSVHSHHLTTPRRRMPRQIARNKFTKATTRDARLNSLNNGCFNRGLIESSTR